MARSYVQVHLNSPVERITVAWYSSKKYDPYGVIDFGDLKLFLASEQLNALDQAVQVLQRERDGQEG